MTISQQHSPECCTRFEAIPSAIHAARRVQLVEHLRCGDEDDALSRETRPVSKGASEKRLAGARIADEQRIDTLVDEARVEQAEVGGFELLPEGVEVEVEAVDGVDLGEASISHAAVDGALEATTGLLFVGEAAGDLERREIPLHLQPMRWRALPLQAHAFAR
jgi:hypothetical protein